jgi:hypothetical protein
MQNHSVVTEQAEGHTADNSIAGFGSPDLHEAPTLLVSSLRDTNPKIWRTGPSLSAIFLYIVIPTAPI